MLGTYMSFDTFTNAEWLERLEYWAFYTYMNTCMCHPGNTLHTYLPFHQQFARTYTLTCCTFCLYQIICQRDRRNKLLFFLWDNEVNAKKQVHAFHLSLSKIKFSRNFMFATPFCIHCAIIYYIYADLYLNSYI